MKTNRYNHNKIIVWQDPRTRSYITDLQLQEEKTRAIQEKLELCEQKLAQFAKLPEMEEELKQRMEALTQVRAQVR